MKAVTADEFAAQLRAGGCEVTDWTHQGDVYLSAKKVARGFGRKLIIVFRDGRFAYAFSPDLGTSTRRRAKIRTMKGVRAWLDVTDHKAAKKEHS